MSNVTELKEENAMLNERLSQYEEKIQFISSSKVFSEEKWREEKETMEILHSKEKKTLEKRIVSLEEELNKVTACDMTEETEEKIKSLVREMERKLARMEAEHEDELERLREVQEEEVGRMNREHKELVGRLNSDLRGLVEQVEVQEQEREAAITMGAEEAREQLEQEQARHRQAANQ